MLFIVCFGASGFPMVIMLKAFGLLSCFSFKVIDLGGEPISANQYFHLGRVTEFKYGARIGGVFRKWNGDKLSYTKYVSVSVYLYILYLVFISMNDVI